jgi:hypothetical protein
LLVLGFWNLTETTGITFLLGDAKLAEMLRLSLSQAG